MMEDLEELVSNYHVITSNTDKSETPKMISELDEPPVSVVTCRQDLEILEKLEEPVGNSEVINCSIDRSEIPRMISKLDELSSVPAVTFKQDLETLEGLEELVGISDVITSNTDKSETPTIIPELDDPPVPVVTSRQDLEMLEDLEELVGNSEVINCNTDNSETPTMISELDEPPIQVVTSRKDLETDEQLFEAESNINNKQVGATSTQAPIEIKLPQIQMVFGEFNEAVFKNLDILEAVATLGTESTRIKESECPKFDGESCNKTSRDEIMQNDQTKQNQLQVEVFSETIKDSCRLESNLGTNNSKIEKLTLNNVQIGFDQRNNNSTNAVGNIQPETTQVNSVQNEQATTIQEDATINSWKQIPIKQELIDIDEDFNTTDYSTTATPYLGPIKSEIQIKSEVIDVDEIPDITFECKKCNREFTQESILRLHIICHANPKMCQCDECDYITRHRTRMLNHLRKHTGEKKIKCKICNETYFSTNELRHFRRCPKPIKNLFCCVDCDYNTTLKYRYVQHVRLHTGERLKCAYCDLAFLSDLELKTHRKKHAKEKRYQCKFCYRRFKIQNAREQHVLAYCGRKCPKCDYISIYCFDFYQHVVEAHPFTKLKHRFLKHYNVYQNTLARNLMTMPMENFRTEPKYVTTYEEYKPNIGHEMDIKIQQNSDSDFMQNMKYEFSEGTETYRCEPLNFSDDYSCHLMQNNNFDVCVKQNECEVEENIHYDLIQNVNCELTEDSEDYTLLCL